MSNKKGGLNALKIFFTFMITMLTIGCLGYIFYLLFTSSLLPAILNYIVMALTVILIVASGVLCSIAVKNINRK